VPRRPNVCVIQIFETKPINIKNINQRLKIIKFTEVIQIDAKYKK